MLSNPICVLSNYSNVQPRVWWLYQVLHNWRKLTFPLKSPPVPISFQQGVRLHFHLPFSKLALCLPCVCTNLPFAVTVSVDSYVNLPYSVWKTCFSWNHPAPLALIVFPCLSLNTSLTFIGRAVLLSSHLELGTLKSGILCMMTSCGSSNVSSYCKKLSGERRVVNFSIWMATNHWELFYCYVYLAE